MRLRVGESRTLDLARWEVLPSLGDGQRRRARRLSALDLTPCAARITPMRRLAAIFFDIDDTLYSTTEFVDEARSAAVDAMIGAGLRLERDRVLAELRAVVDQFSSNYERHYNAVLARVPPGSYEPVNPAMIVAAGVAAYHDTKVRKLKPYPDAAELLSRLGARGTPLLGIVSTGSGVKQAEKLIRLDLARHLAPGAVFFCDELGLPKNDLRIWRRATEDLRLDARECMVVGDNPPNDIDPPAELGMVTVLVRRGGKYSDVEPRLKADFVIRGFRELGRILAAEFGVRAAAPRGRRKGGRQHARRRSR